MYYAVEIKNNITNSTNWNSCYMSQSTNAYLNITTGTVYLVVPPWISEFMYWHSMFCMFIVVHAFVTYVYCDFTIKFTGWSTYYYFGSDIHSLIVLVYALTGMGFESTTSKSYLGRCLGIILTHGHNKYIWSSMNYQYVSSVW